MGFRFALLCAFGWWFVLCWALATLTLLWAVFHVVIQFLKFVSWVAIRHCAALSIVLNNSWLLLFIIVILSRRFLETSFWRITQVFRRAWWLQEFWRWLVGTWFWTNRSWLFLLGVLWSRSPLTLAWLTQLIYPCWSCNSLRAFLLIALLISRLRNRSSNWTISSFWESTVLARQLLVCLLRSSSTYTIFVQGL